MRKSSRFWWLHGAILLAAAAAGCRSCKDGTCGGPGQGAGPTGLTGSTSAAMYNQGTSGYPGMSSSGMSSGGMPAGGMSSGGMPAGQSYAPSGGASYPAPGLSSGLGAPH